MLVFLGFKNTYANVLVASWEHMKVTMTIISPELVDRIRWVILCL